MTDSTHVSSQPCGVPGHVKTAHDDAPGGGCAQAGQLENDLALDRSLSPVVDPGTGQREAVRSGVALDEPRLPDVDHVKGPEGDLEVTLEPLALTGPALRR